MTNLKFDVPLRTRRKAANGQLVRKRNCPSKSFVFLQAVSCSFVQDMAATFLDGKCFAARDILHHPAKNWNENFHTRHNGAMRVFGDRALARSAKIPSILDAVAMRAAQRG